MPSQRKRIGFLPRSEVQNIIDKICIHNKLSQSKVTGILVEEALRYRGVLETSKSKLSRDSDYNKIDSLLINNDDFISEKNNKEDNINLDDISMKDEVQMINDFIEYRFFKNIMIRKNKNY